LYPAFSISLENLPVLWRHSHETLARVTGSVVDENKAGVAGTRIEAGDTFEVVELVGGG